MAAVVADLIFKISEERLSELPHCQSTFLVNLDSGQAISAKLGTHRLVILTVPRKDLTSMTDVGSGNLAIFWI